MKRLMLAGLTVVLLSAAIAPAATAGSAGTTTCPDTNSYCTGSGGASSR